MTILEFLLPRFRGLLRTKPLAPKQKPEPEQSKKRRGRPKGSRNSDIQIERQRVQWTDDMKAVVAEMSSLSKPNVQIARKIGVHVETFRSARKRGVFGTPGQAKAASGAEVKDV